jgi:transposase InsO family protein
MSTWFFYEFCSMINNQFGITIKALRIDNGTEYTNQVFQIFLRDKRILHQISYVGTPQHNGIMERKNKYLLKITRALLFSGNLPNFFLG